MNSGERLATLSVDLPAADRRSIASNGVRIGEGDAADNWESLFSQLPPSQQHPLLTLALKQRLPRADQAAFDSSCFTINDLLTGNAAGPLIAFQPSSLPPVDAELDVTQRA